MTFYEAAIAVLRATSRPLLSGKICDLALKRGLLSHEGRHPEMTMTMLLLSRMELEESSPVIRLSGGHFALREWDEGMLSTIEDGEETESRERLEDARRNFPFSLNEEDVAQVLSMQRIEVRERFRRQEISVPESDWAGSYEHVSDEGNFDRMKDALSQHVNEHYNLCAAVVKVLRDTDRELNAEEISEQVRTRYELCTEASGIVIALRSDNALRKDRGKRALFYEDADGKWLLSELKQSRQQLRTEGKIHEYLRQLRSLVVHNYSNCLRSLSPAAWHQLCMIALKQLDYVILNKIDDENFDIILRADEPRGLIAMPVLVSITTKTVLRESDISRLRALVVELSLSHGIILTQGDTARDAQAECAVNELPIHVYGPWQIASILINAHVGVDESFIALPRIDHHFFRDLYKSFDSSPLAENENDLSGEPESLL